MRPKPSLRALLRIFALAVVAPATASAATVDLPATRDTWLRESNPTEVHGADDELKAKRKPGDHERPMFEFGIGALGGGFVRSASLQLQVTADDASGEPVEIHRVTSPWSEATATWATHGDAFDEKRVYGSFVASPPGPVSVDVTALVREWADGLQPAHGLMLIPTSLDDESKYASREWSIAPEQPVLVVDVVPVLMAPVDLAVSKTVSDAAPFEADPFTYKVTVTNLGLSPATGVEISEPLPVGLTYLTDRPEQGVYFPGTGQWIVGSLDAGESVSLGIEVVANPGTGGSRITNVASVSALDQTDPNPLNDSDSAPIDVKAAPYRAATGTFIGNGGTQAITGIGFPPDVVLIQGETTASPLVATTITMPSGFSDVLNKADPLVPGLILSLDDDGFSVGPDRAVNEAGTDFHWIAFRAAGDSLGLGSFVGNGTDQPVDVGFRPTYVVVISESNEHSIQRFAAQPDGLSLDFDGSAELTNRILSFDPTGFRVGTDKQVNESGVTFHWLAWGAVADVTADGSYRGDDTDDRDISVGFRPDWVLVRRQNQKENVHRPASLAGDAAFGVKAGPSFPDAIQVLLPDGFQVGMSDKVNKHGIDNYWIALRDPGIADLELTKAGTPDPVDPLQILTWTVTLVNRGPDDATGVQVTDVLPGDVVYQYAVPDQGSYSNVSGIWNVGTIAAGETLALDLVTRVVATPSGATITNGAAVSTVDAPDPLPGNEADSVTVAVNGTDLAVTKTVDDSAPSEGDAVLFTVHLANLGPGSVSGVQVTDSLPAGLTLQADSTTQGSWNDVTGVWDVGALSAGQQAYLFLSATVDAGTAGSTLTNVATITAASRIDPVPSNDADSVSVFVQAADLAVSKSVDDPTPNEGDGVAFTVTVANLGPSTATGVILSDSLPVGLTYAADSTSQGTYDSGSGLWNVGTVVPGDSAVLVLQALVDAGTAGKTIVNRSRRLASFPGDPNTANDEAVVAVTVQSADLAVSKAVDDATPNEGDTVRFLLGVRNLGPDDATGVLLRDLLQPGLAYVADSTGHGSYDPLSGNWSVGDLATGEVAVLALSAVVEPGTAGTTIPNTLRVVSSDVGDPVPGNDLASLSLDVQAADLAVKKAVDMLNPSEGDGVQFTVTLSNGGPDRATGVEVTDLLPAGLTYVSSFPTAGSYDDVTGIWSVGVVDTLLPVSLTLRARVDAGTAGSVLTNGASITATDVTDPDPTNDTATVAVTVQSADLALTKAVDDPTPNEGDSVTYTILVANGGPNDAAGVTVSDLLPAGVTWVGDAPERGSYDPGAGIWDVGAIVAGDTARLDITVSVDAGTGGTVITNTAAVTASSPGDPVPGNDSDSADLDVQSADLAVGKTVNNPAPVEGGTVTYTLTVGNLGPDPATGIVVQDTLPAGLTFQSSGGDGSYDDVSGLWTPGAVAAGDSATLLLTASVDAGTAGQTIWNVATRTAADQADPDGSNDADSVSILVGAAPLVTADLEITKSVDQPAPDEGDPIRYAVLLRNLGPDDATGVQVADLLPGGVTWTADSASQGSYAPGTGLWNVGAVAAGDNASLELFADVDTGSAGSSIVNVASVSASDQLDPSPANNSDSATLTVRAADLVVRKEVDAGTVDEGDTVRFEVVVRNEGPDPTGGIALADALPAGLTLAADSTSQGSYAAGTWDVGAIAAGDSAALVLTATADAGTGGSTLTNVAAVTASDRGDPDTTNDADSAAVYVRAADLSVRKTIDRSDPAEGDSLTFTVTLHNGGPDDATGIAVTDLPPAGLTAFADSTSQGAWAGGPGLWTVGAVAAGDSATLILSAVVDAGRAGQTLVNVASISGSDLADPIPGNDADSAAVTVRSADLAVSHAVDDPTPREGDTVHFTVVVRNLGPDDGAGIELLDPLPSGLTEVADSVSQGSRDGGTGLWTVGALAAGDSATLVLTASVDAGTAGSTITNVAAVTASAPGDPNPFNDTAAAAVTVATGILLSGLQVSSVALPGAANVALFTLGLANSHAYDVTLESVTFANTTSGPGTPAQRDAELGTLTLYQDDGNRVFEPARDVPLAQATASAGNVTFGGISLGIPSGALTGFHVGADVALTARDGDRLDLSLNGPSAVVFQEAVTFTNAWPIAPPGYVTVDGMAAAQIVVADPGGRSVLPGSVDVLALDAVLPPNGYDADELRQFRVRNLGDALPGTDLQALALWVDGGDGVFGSGLRDDIPLGPLTNVGATWERTGLTVPIPVGGLRVFVTADVAGSAVPGRTIRLEIPSGTGVIVASGNDGPIDAAVSVPSSIVVQSPPSVLTADAPTPAGAPLLPGADPVEVLRFRVFNHAAVAETLSAVTVTNETVGPGTQAQLDADWTTLRLVQRAGSDGISVAGPRSASMSAGQATFTGVGAVIAPGDTAVFAVEGGASLAARDGDVLDLALADSTALVFTRPVQLTASWPLDPAGAFPVDGMAAKQIGLVDLPTALLSGTTRNPVLGVVVPANGYEPDTLRYLNVRNLGTAQPFTDLSRVEAWCDVDGDGSFEPAGDDASGLLGEMAFTGNRWEKTALALPLPPGGVMVVICCDVALDATAGATVRFALPTSPDFGIGVESGNDGPRDRDVASAASLPITLSDRVSFQTVQIAPGTAAPGQDDVALLHVRLRNDYSVTKSLTGLTVRNLTSGPGSTAERDAEAGALRLRADSLGAAELAQAIFSAGQASFTAFTLPLAPGQTRDVFVTADLSATLAADGDVLGTEVTDEADVTFLAPTTLVASWPLDSGARWTVDGMLAAQITNHSAPNATLGPGEGPALALDVTLPSNGYAADILRGVGVTNLGTAVAGDIDQMRLWRDGGNGAFDAGAGDDTSLGPLTPVGADWISPLLATTVPPGGARCFVSVTSSPALVDSTTVRLAIPVGGVTVESGNDGPLDAPVANDESILFSTAALLVDLDVQPDASTLGDLVSIVMDVRNVGATSIDGIAPSALAPDVPGVLVPVGGPVPSTLDLAPAGQGSFTWSYQADSAGTVRFTGSASGTEQGSGLMRQSLTATSDEHRAFVESRELALFATESMPFSINRGQTGVVPLSLTFTNNAGSGASDVCLRGFSVDLRDGADVGIVPADLLYRVVVNEGTNVYLSRTNLETSGSTIDLTLAVPVLVPSQGQVTISISLDVSDSAAVPSFRLVIPDSTRFIAEDATSSAPVTIQLEPGESYPVQSGLARVVAEATELDVAAVPSAPLLVGRGQDAVPLLDLRLLNPDPDSLAADVRVTAFEVTLTDSAGVAIDDPQARLERIRVKAPFQTFLDRPVTALDDTTIALTLSPLLSVPVNAPVPITVEADVADGAPLAAFRLRLADPSRFDARDANTGAPLPVLYETTPIEGPLTHVRLRADSMLASGTPLLPEELPVGTPDVAALAIALSHAGDPVTAPVRIDSLTIQCRDAAGYGLVPTTYLDQVRVLRGGTEVGLTNNLPAQGGQFTLALAGVRVDPLASDTLEIRADFEVTAPATGFRLDVAAAGVHATDEILGSPVLLHAAVGAEFPLTSGLTQLQSPARELIAGFEDTMPPVLAADGGGVSFATVTVSNPAAPTAGDIRLDHLRVRAADRDLVPLDLGAAVAGLEAWVDGELWAASGDLAEIGEEALLPAGEELVLGPGVARAIELRARLRAGTEVSALRLGLVSTDIGIMQPQSPLLSVSVVAAPDQSLPFWTLAGNFSGASLEESWSNFPNPFAAGRDRTTFAFFLEQPARVTLKVWSARGREVLALLQDAPLAAGLHQEHVWDGRNGRGDTVVNGVYLAEISVAFEDGSSARLVRKVAVVR